MMQKLSHDVMEPVMFVHCAGSEGNVRTIYYTILATSSMVLLPALVWGKPKFSRHCQVNISSEVKHAQ